MNEWDLILFLTGLGKFLNVWLKRFCERVDGAGKGFEDL